MLSQPLHTFKTGDTFVGTAVAGETVVISETRNAEHAAEGHFGTLLTVIPLQEAIKLAKALIASQEEPLTEDEKFDAWIDAQYQRWLDHKALVDDALASDVRF